MFGGVCGGERGNTVELTLFADFSRRCYAIYAMTQNSEVPPRKKAHQIAYLRCLIGFCFFLTSDICRNVFAFFLWVCGIRNG